MWILKAKWCVGISTLTLTSSVTLHKAFVVVSLQSQPSSTPSPHLDMKLVSLLSALSGPVTALTSRWWQKWCSGTSENWKVLLLSSGNAPLWSPAVILEKAMEGHRRILLPMDIKDPLPAMWASHLLQPSWASRWMQPQTHHKGQRNCPAEPNQPRIMSYAQLVLQAIEFWGGLLHDNRQLKQYLALLIFGSFHCKMGSIMVCSYFIRLLWGSNEMKSMVSAQGCYGYLCYVMLIIIFSCKKSLCHWLKCFKNQCSRWWEHGRKGGNWK